jgi:hypothetical protein
MHIRHFAIASALSLATLMTAGPQAQAGPMDYCKADVERLCPGVPMGGGRIIGCLKAHKMDVSVGCAKALQKVKSEMK